MKNKKIIPVKFALHLTDDLVMFMKKEEEPLFLGFKDHYKNLGEYTGELFKLCNSEECYVFYSLMNILNYADKPEAEKKLELVDFILQQEDEKF